MRTHWLQGDEPRPPGEGTLDASCERRVRKGRETVETQPLVFHQPPLLFSLTPRRLSLDTTQSRWKKRKFYKPQAKVGERFKSQIEPLQSSCEDASRGRINPGEGPGGEGEGGRGARSQQLRQLAGAGSVTPA